VSDTAETCQRCKCPVELGHVVWLELDRTTGRYHVDGTFPFDGESLDLFPFGADCARLEVWSHAEKRPAAP